jgi:branched-chain amino acid transport system substrate-binding protein
MKLKVVPLLLLATFLLACSAGNKTEFRTSQQAIDVKIGVVQSLTGTGAVYGKPALQGIELAIREVNASQVEPRIRLTYGVTDDASSVDGGKAAFGEYAGQQITAIIGPTLSNVAVEALKLSQLGLKPAIAPTTTGAGITNLGDYVFRVALTEDIVVPATLEYVHKQTPIRRAVLFLDSDDAFSRSSAEAMRKGIAAIGATIVREVDVSKQPDLAQAVTSSQGEQADAFLVTPLLDRSVAILKALRAGGLKQTVVGGNSFNTLDIARLAGEAAEGAYVGAAWNPALATPESRRFVEAYAKAYGTAPDQFAAQGYASAQLLASAIRSAGSASPNAVRDALASATTVMTPLGDIAMSAQRDAVHAPVVQQYRGGQLTVVR